MLWESIYLTSALAVGCDAKLIISTYADGALKKQVPKILENCRYCSPRAQGFVLRTCKGLVTHYRALPEPILDGRQEKGSGSYSKQPREPDLSWHIRCCQNCLWTGKKFYRFG